MKIQIFDPENWREIGATLSRNKTRTFLTAFGIFWGTAMLAMLWGAASGLEGMMMRNFAGFTTNMGIVYPGQRSESYRGFNKGSYYSLTVEDIDVIKRVAPAIEYISTLTQASTTAIYGKNSKTCTVMGVDPDYTEISAPVIDAGRFINANDVATNAKVAVIGKDYATDLFGLEDPMGKLVSLNGVFFRIIGVCHQLSDASVGARLDECFVVPSSTMRRAFNRGHDISMFVFTSPRGHQPSENKAAIQRALSVRHTFSPSDPYAVSFRDVSEQFEMIDNLFAGISLLALFVGFGSLMAGVIGVGNIMWIVVKERTQEFGIRRAIGAKPLDITMQVLSESVLLTLVAGTAGVCFAAIVLGVVDHFTADPVLGHAGFELGFGTAVSVLLTFFILGSAAGTLPAVKAMKIKPIEAIHSK